MEGLQLSQYRIEFLLGSGAFCDTYRAVDTVRRRPVALKILRPNHELDLAHIIQQARLASDLVHPHLAWVWEAAQAEGHTYIAERFVDGAPLAQMITGAGPLPWAEALQIVQHIAQGLDFAQTRKWVHGNLNPKNILISPDLGAVLTDFGQMYALRSSGIRYTAANYAAPEIWEDHSPSHASDQYALACVLVELLTAQPLFAGETTEDIRDRHLAGLELLPGDIPWATIPALRRALARNPESRYPTTGMFTDALLRLAEQVSEEPDERARREAAAQAWREVQEKARRHAEESIRLAALEQARREIDEQRNLESGQKKGSGQKQVSAQKQVSEQTPVDEQPHVPEQTLFSDLEPPAGEHTSPADSEPFLPASINIVPLASPLLESDDLEIPEMLSTTALSETSRRRARRRRPSKWWWIGLAALILLLVFSALFLDSRRPRQQIFPPTPTSTSPPPSATFSPSPSPSPSATLTATVTATTTATPTHTPTPSVTMTATITATPTITFTPTWTPTATRTPRRITPEGTDSIVSPQRTSQAP